ncbi:uncharacterized protein LOC106639099 [Copidosoma floridanum]|uniref:uncharacterized protein LOC106639099 n=1 Tax=Copidosoma floridanum TaxID=29053 RepID=UPI0006C9D674|nr:uncharacterized protein LOC106639099 [Copidosoma floridanum]
MYQRNDMREAGDALQGNRRQEFSDQSHCYTNPSFCRQSEYLPEDPGNNSGSSDLPPPPQFQLEELPPPPEVQQSDFGQVNQAFHGSPESELSTGHHHRRTVSNLNHTTADRYCYIDESADQPPPPPSTSSATVSHKRYGSLPLGGADRRPYAYNRTNRYEYIQDDVQLQVQCQPQQPAVMTAATASSRYEYIEKQQVQQRVCPAPPSQQTPVRSAARTYRSANTHYTSLAPDAEVNDPSHWNEDDARDWDVPQRRQINTPNGRYTSIPMQEEYPPSLPERNGGSHDGQQPRIASIGGSNNALATQKLHEILTTPRKPRKRSQSEALSPIKTPQQQGIAPIHRGGFTPGCSPSSTAGHRAMNSPMRPQPHHHTTPQSRALSPRSKGPTTSTPNKEPPSARRCLPLNEPLIAPSQSSMLRRHLEDSQAAAYGRSPQATSTQQLSRYHPPDSAAEEAMYVEHKKAGFYHQAVDGGAYVSRTAVVSPLSPPVSEANTTLVSSTDKFDRKNAPVLLMLVGILTCGLAIYLSWTQERRYYYDSAVGCGAFCALAGASRSLRRTWTGLCLAGLCVVTCAGLFLLSAKSPRIGTPLHDVTAGALCGVSLLGAALAFLALLSPRCTLGRHHRVHSWIPSFAA